jgi:HK97 family phage major capsid protein
MNRCHSREANFPGLQVWRWAQKERQRAVKVCMHGGADVTRDDLTSPGFHMADKNRNLDRSCKITRDKIDDQARTIEVAFSSEEPVERWGENEVLSHEKGDYDFSRLNDSHPLLLGHNEYDPSSQIGVVESARVDKDKIGRAVVRFSKSALGEEIFQDVKDGIRQLVSVGYDRTGVVDSKKSKDNMVTTRYRWMPTHIAIVPVPADTKVGVGRDHRGDAETRATESEKEREKPTTPVDTEKFLNVKNLTEAEKTILRSKLMAEETKTSVEGIDEKKVRANERELATTESKTRMNQIIAACDELIKDHGRKNAGKFGDELRTLAMKHMHEGKSIGDFQVEAMQQVLKAKAPKPVLLEECTDENGRRQYSLLRGVQSAFKARERGGAGIPDGVEGEVHAEIINRSREYGGLGYESNGFQVPINLGVSRANLSRAERSILGRDMQATVFPAGGALVPSQLMVPVIELLRNRMVLALAGVTTLGGLQGNIFIPRLDAPATAYSVGEIDALTASQQILGQIALTPRRVGATEIYSKQLIQQSTPDVEALIRDDLFKVIALKWDALGIAGSGAAGEPVGIINQPGIGSIIFGATPTYSKIVSMETQIRAANVLDPLTYVSTPTVKGALKTVAEALTGATTIGGSQNAIWKRGTGDLGEVNGYPAIDSNQVPNNLVLLGAFSQLIQAMWGGLDIVVDIYTKAANAEVALTINTWGDFAARHPQAFCVSADAGNQ